MTDSSGRSEVRGRLALIGVLFVCSGANGLMIEQIFEKLISTVVGGVPAVPLAPS